MIEHLLVDANDARVAGRYPDAESLFMEARRRISKAPLSTCLEAAHYYSLLASLRLEQLRPREAAPLLVKAASIAEGYRDDALLAKVVHKQGFTADELGQPDEALRLLLRAKRLYRALGDAAGDALALNEIALVLAGAGDTDRAMRFHLLAEPAARQHLTPRAMRAYDWTRGVIALRAGLYATALTVFESVIESAAADHDTVAGANALLHVAEARAGAGDYEGVEEVAVQLVALFQSLGVTPCVLAAAELLRAAARCRLTALAECILAVRTARRR